MKPIPHYSQYSINEDGTVIIRTSTGNQLRPGFQVCKGKQYPEGYYYVSLSSPDNSAYPRRLPVHRLVALTYCFNPDPINNIWVNHEDGNKLNNHYTNLKWGTVSYNIKHSISHGLRKINRGADHYLYGRKYSKATKNKMAAAKLGELHPKFKGYYITPFGTFASSGEAQRATGINSRTVYNRCKNSIKGYSFSGKH